MITGFYACFGVIGAIALSMNVIRKRKKHKIAIGTDNPELARAARAQGNYMEYMPFFLLLMMLCEIGGGVSDGLLHMAGVAFFVGRASHAWSLLVVEPTELKEGLAMRAFRFRKAGMITTFMTLGLLGVLALWRSLT